MTASPALVLCWLATLTWTFGFDTVYAMADRPDDRKLVCAAVPSAWADMP